MRVKNRKESEELMLFRALQVRMKLSEKELKHWQNLEKGYTGELMFDTHLEKLCNDCLLLNDVLLDYSDNLFQMDSLLIFQDSIYLFEVKNYEGDFYKKGERWYTIVNSEIKDPLLQLRRSESLLRRFLQEHGCSVAIEPFLVFVNPEFYLYQAPLNAPIIYPTQINRFLRNLSNKPSQLNNHHKKIADKLLSIHIDKSPIIRRPAYAIDQLTKGITCPTCHTFVEERMTTSLICNKCGTTEGIDQAIVRSVHEYSLLFPERKITTNDIYTWCSGVIQSKKTVRRVLLQNFEKTGDTRATFFIDKR